MEVMKIACRRKWKQIWLKMGFLRPKNSKDENFWDLKLFKNQNWENYLQNGVWEKLFLKSGDAEMGDGTWLKDGHAKMHGWESW